MTSEDIPRRRMYIMTTLDLGFLQLSWKDERGIPTAALVICTCSLRVHSYERLRHMHAVAITISIAT